MTVVELAELELPEFGVPQTEPEVPDTAYAARLDRARARAAAAGYDALVVYGDREHSANLAYLTKYDPRFEEGMLILTSNDIPMLLVGNEGVAYARIVPVPVQVVLYQTFSLVSQPRGESQPLTDILRAGGIRPGMRVGAVGWKYFDGRETEQPEGWVEIPAFIVDTLRDMGCTVVNATALFMHPSEGLRAINELEQLAAFEFAATYGSQGMRNALFNLRPGMTEYEVAQLWGLIGKPVCYHPVMQSGERTMLALVGPSMRRLQIGDPASMALGYWGSNNARGGFIVRHAGELPEGARDYVETLVAPYFAAVVEWYEHLGIGVTGGELFDIIDAAIGDPFFGVTLNPGHLIHLDEWVSSPIYRGSKERLQSGMAIQVDVIPATGTVYHTSNIEDSLVLADEPLRQAFAAQYPEAWGRIQARRAFMQDVLGIRLKPEVLPFSNIPAYLPPYWLSPHMAMRVVR